MKLLVEKLIAHFRTVQWNTKEDNAPQSFFNERAEESLKLVHAPAALTRQGGYFNLGIGIIGDEDRIHEHRLGQCTSGLP